MGYSKVFKDSKIVSSIEELNAEDNIRLSMIDGEINCKICGDNIWN